MRNVSDKSCRENQNTHFMFKNFFSKVVPFMRQCQKILYSPTGNTTVWCMRITYWLTKGHTRTHAHSLSLSQYVILIAFHCNNCYKYAPRCYITHTLPYCSN